MSAGLLNQLESYFSDVDVEQGPVSPDHVAELFDHVREVVPPTPVPVRGRQQVWIAAAAFAIVLVLVGGLVLLAPFGGNNTTPADQPAPTIATTTSLAGLPLTPESETFMVDGAIEIEWVELEGEVPYGINSYDAGVYTTVGDGGSYTADEAMSWTFEAAVEGAMVPDKVSEDGQWGMVTGFFTGTLLRNVDGEWQVAPRPPQTDQSGDWGWMRHLESSGDVLMVLGGPAEPGSDGYPAEETAAYWRIDGTGEWQKSNLDWDYANGNIRSVPVGGFAYYNEAESIIHTSVDGVEWTGGVSTDFPYWESGDEVFPGLVYAERAGQIWTSSDGITWTYEFTSPPGGDYGVHLNRTNLGIVATRVTQIPGEDSNSDTSIDSWLLAEDRRSWSVLTSFSVGTLSYGGVNHGAAGDLVWLSVTGGEAPSLTPLNRMWTAQLSNQ